MDRMQDESDYVRLHEKVIYPIVQVRTKKAGGSGTLIYSEPNEETGNYETFVLTNHHVIKEAISIEEEWNSTIGRELPTERRAPVEVRNYVYRDVSWLETSQLNEADIVVWDEKHDMALLHMRTVRKFEHTVDFYDPDKVRELRMDRPLIACGCSLLHKPLADRGELKSLDETSENLRFWMSGTNITFGNCVPAGTLISMSDGSVKPIEAIKPGDRVWSAGHTAGLVQDTVEEQIESGEKEIYELRLTNRLLRASGNHPVLIVRSGRDWTNKLINYATWATVEEIEEGDKIAILPKLPNREVGSGFNFTKAIGQHKDRVAFMRLLGYYLGDGWMRHDPGYRYEMSLACYDQDDWHTYRDIIKDIFDVEPVSYLGESDVLQVNSKDLVELLDEIGFDGKATEKTIPDWVMTQPPEYQMAFIQGYLEADGYELNEHTWVFEANNPELIARLRMMFIHLGIRVSNLFTRWREPREVKGKTAVSNAPSSSFQAYIGSDKSLSSFIQGDTSWLPEHLDFQQVSRKDMCGVEPTYDIKLKNYHNFFADGVLVHNSGGAMFTGDTYEFLGIPSRLDIAGWGFGGDPQNFLNYFIPINRIRDIVADEWHYEFLFYDDVTIAESRKRKKEYQDAVRQALEERFQRERAQAMGQ